MKPIIYQVLTRLYGNTKSTCQHGGTLEQNGSGKMNDFTARRLAALRDRGYTHIWYTGLLDHATGTDFSAFGLPADDTSLVKGIAGSPYAVRDYYNVAPELAVSIPDRLKEFDNLVRRTHRAGLKVVMDFIPNHVAANYIGSVNPFTDANFHSGRLHDGDWTDTAKLNYGNHDTWEKMRDILFFWTKRGVDAFRCDMAELVPVEFWEWVIPQVKALRPHLLFIAEVYQPWQYRSYIEHGHFDYLYDKVGLYDTLIALLKGHESATAITRCWQSLGDIGAHMLHFLENHDEQRLASSFICGDGRRALPALVISALMDTCPLMCYFGQEYGESGMETEGFSGIDGKTTIFDYWSIGTIRRHIDDTLHSDSTNTQADDELTKKENILAEEYEKVFRICSTEPAVSEGKFFDLMYVQNEDFDIHRQYAFLRHHDGALLLVCANFADYPVNVRVRLPEHAFSYFGIADDSPARLHACTDLLSGYSTTLPLSSASPVPLTIQANSAAVVKFAL